MTVERSRVGWGFWFWWVLASTMGWFFGFFVGAIGGYAVEPILPNYGGAALHAALAAGVGIFQWLVLCLVLRWRVSRAGWWVLASTVGWAVSMAVYIGVGDAMGFPMGFSPLAVSVAAGGIGLGAITGLALVWLLRQPVPEASKGRQALYQ